MQYTLIWLEWLAIAVFFAIFWVAVSCRFKNESNRILGSIGAVLIPGAVFILLSFFTVGMLNKNVGPTWLFFCDFLVTSVYFVIAIVLVVRAHQKTEHGPRAKQWPLMRNALIFFLLVSINLFTLFISERIYFYKLEKRLITLQTMIADYLPEPPPPSQNAAIMLEKAAPLIEEIDSDYLKTANDPDFDAISADARNFLSQYKNVLNLLHQAASMPLLYYPDLIDPMMAGKNIEVGNIVYLINSVRLLAFEARSHSQQGRIDKAMESLFAIRRLAMLNFRIGSNTKSLLAAYLEKEAFRCQKNVLYDIQNTKIIISGKKLYSDEIQTKDILRILAVEETFIVRCTLDPGNLLTGINISDSSFQETHLRSPLKKSLTWLQSRMINIFFASYQMDYVNQMIAGMRHMAPFDCKTVWKQMEVLQAITDNSIYDYTWMFEHITNFPFRSKAYRRLGKLALATTAYFNDTGRYPDTLEALAPQYISHIPIDPFDMECGLMKLKPYGKGVMLYSNGMDKIDEHGYVRQKNSENSDIVIILGEKPIWKKRIWEMMEEEEEKE